MLRVPTSALMEGGRVLRFDPKSRTLQAVTLKTGVANWEYTEVLAGLQAGDRIVLSLEREGVREGALVTPENGTPKGK